MLSDEVQESFDVAVDMFKLYQKDLNQYQNKKRDSFYMETQLYIYKTLLSLSLIEGNESTNMKKFANNHKTKGFKALKEYVDGLPEGHLSKSYISGINGLSDITLNAALQGTFQIVSLMNVSLVNLKEGG